MLATASPGQTLLQTREQLAKILFEGKGRHSRQGKPLGVEPAKHGMGFMLSLRMLQGGSLNQGASGPAELGDAGMQSVTPATAATGATGSRLRLEAAATSSASHSMRPGSKSTKAKRLTDV